MNRHLLLIAFIILLGCQRTEEKQIVSWKKTKQEKTDTPIKLHTKDWDEIEEYVGKFSKETDLFEKLIIKNELIRILGTDYKIYQNHISLSGCGIIEKKGNLIFGDVSQLHVGGYGSLFFIETQEMKMHLFWLYGTVTEKKYKIYGDKPIPEAILKLIMENMNTGWGHVAYFKIVSDSLVIELK